MWAEIVLGLICLALGLICAGLALLALFANAMGGVTNRSAVNLWPVVALAIMAVLGFGAGVGLLA
jgi:hypothetical protein